MTCPNCNGQRVVMYADRGTPQPCEVCSPERPEPDMAGLASCLQDEAKLTSNPAVKLRYEQAAARITRLEAAVAERDAELRRLRPLTAGPAVRAVISSENGRVRSAPTEPPA